MVVVTSSSTENILIDRTRTSFESKRTNLSLMKSSTIVQTLLGVILSLFVITVVVVILVFISIQNKAYVPRLQPDEVTVTKRTVIQINALDNDQNPEQLKIMQVTSPRHGTARISRDGTYIEYRSVGSYAGFDQFEYTAGTTYKTATSYVNVTVLNRVPTAIDFVLQVSRNSKDNIYRLFELEYGGKRILDVDGDNVTIVACSQPENGALLFSNDTVTYTPNYGFNGTDEVTYKITDRNATVSATIRFVSINNAPIAVADTFIVPKNRMTELSVLSNDYDINFDDLSIVNTTSTRPNRVRMLPDDKQHILYVASVNPAPYRESFQYLITDGYDGYASASVVVNVVNAAPVAMNSSVSVVQNSANNKMAIKYSDVDAMDEHSAKIIDGPYQGKADITILREVVEVVYDNARYTVIKNQFTIVYTPNLNYLGDDKIQYQITDGYDTSEAFVYIKLLALPPIAQADEVTCQKNLYVDVNVLSNDYDQFGLPITMTSPQNNVSIPSAKEGKVRRMDNTLRYFPPLDFTGLDQFTYTISNVPSDVTRSTSSKAQVTINVVNTRPIAKSDYIQLRRNDTAYVNVLENDHDVNGDKIELVSVGQAPDDHTSDIVKVNGVMMVRIQSGRSIKNFTLKYTIADIPDGATAQGTIYVSFANIPPVAQDDKATVLWNRPALIDVISNDSDENSEDVTKLQVLNVQQPQNGRVEIFNATCIKYTPNSGFIGSDSFRYRCSDGKDPSPYAAVSVQVINHAPVAVNDTISVHWRNSVRIKVLNNDYDVDNDPLSIIDVTQPSDGHVVIEGSVLLYTPTQVGSEVIEYTISDSAYNDTAFVHVSVTNTPPQAHDDYLELHWSFKEIDIPVLENDTDIDGDNLRIISVEEGALGNFTITNDQKKLSFSCDACLGDVSVLYHISDGVDESSAMLMISITNNHTVSGRQLVSKVHWREFMHSPVYFELWNGSTDEDGDKIQITIHDNATNETDTHVMITDRSSMIVLQSTENWKVGVVSINYTISDGLVMNDQQGSITLISTNEPPVAKNYNITLEWNRLQQGIYFDVLVDSFDPDELDKSQLYLVSVDTVGIGQGTVDVQSLDSPHLNQTILYKPGQNETGEFNFQYLISDGLDTALGNVTINVLPTPLRVDELYFSFNWTEAERGIQIDLVQSLQQNLVLLDQSFISEHNSTISVVDNTLEYRSSQFLGEESFVIQALTPTPAPIFVHIEVFNNTKPLDSERNDNEDES